MLGLKKKVERPFNDEELLKQYEDGKILQVNNQVDNKGYLKKIDNKILENEKIEPPEIAPPVKKKWNFLKIFKKNKERKDG